MKRRILIAEDEREFGQIMYQFLTFNGYDVRYTDNGQSAYEQFLIFKPELMLFDVNMPEIDGFNLAKIIRKSSTVQIIFITSLSDEDSVITGLGLGNCDYLRKPFGLKELQLRIARAFQLIDAAKGPAVPENDYYLMEKCCIKKDGKLIPLTKNENKLLKVLFENENKICAVDEIIIKIWGDHNIDNMNNLDVLVHKTRKKLEGTPLIIENIRGIGYSIICEA